MPNTGVIRGTHHLTFCVGGAQEDYDFHVRLLGLKSVKKTVLFDGEIPIYHLYYGNETGDASTLLTAFPYRQAGWMGKRGTNQAKQLNLSVPPEAISFWADRLSDAGISAQRVELFGSERLLFSHPCGIPYALVADSDDRAPYEGGGVPGEHAIRGAYGTTTSVREVGEMDFFITTGMGGEHVASEGPNHQYKIGTEEGHGRILELVEEPDLPQGTWHFGEGTIHHQAFDVISEENQQVVKDWIVGPRLHRRLGPQGPRLLLLLLLPEPGRAAGRDRLLDAGGVPDRRGRGRARDAHVHPAALGGPPVGDLPARADRHGRDGRLLVGAALRAASVGPLGGASMPRPRRQQRPEAGHRLVGDVVLALLVGLEGHPRAGGSKAAAVARASSSAIHSSWRLIPKYMGRPSRRAVVRSSGRPSRDPVRTAAPASGRGRRARSSATTHAPCEKPPSTVARPATLSRAASHASMARLRCGSFSLMGS